MHLMLFIIPTGKISGLFYLLLKTCHPHSQTSPVTLTSYGKRHTNGKSEKDERRVNGYIKAVPALNVINAENGLR